MYRLLVASLILFLCAGCYPATTPGASAPLATAPLAQPPTAAPQPLDLTIVHTNDTWGYLLPCG